MPGPKKGNLAMPCRRIALRLFKELDNPLIWLAYAVLLAIGLVIPQLCP